MTAPLGGTTPAPGPSWPPSPSPAPAAAWYPDPSGVGELRYWDGQRWTPGVVIDGVVTERPMPWPPVATGPDVRPTDGPGDDRAHFPGRAVLYALAGFVVGIVGGLALALAGRGLGLPDIGVLLLNLAGLWTGLLGACWRASRRYGTGQIRRDFGLHFGGPDLGWGLLMSLLARVAGAMVVIPFLFGSRKLVGNNTGVYGKVTQSPWTFVVFGAVAVFGAPVVEELFFRGLLLRSLTSVLGVAPAIAVQAVLFGLAHFSPLLGLANFSVMTIIAAAGTIFGITAWWRRTGTSAVAHGAFNLVSVVAAAFVAFG
jgi:membrane protease YdiL (CAAX protease family)